MIVRIAFFTLMASAASVSAQDVVFSPQATETCVTAGKTLHEKRACIGASAKECIDALPEGNIVEGKRACLSKETAYWQARFDAAYDKQIAHAKSQDAKMAGLGENVPSQAAALLDVRRSWEPYREARCGFAQAQWAGKAEGLPAHATCLLVETGEETLYLETARLTE